MSDPIVVELIPSWDAALTYDILDSDDGAPVFVGREDLLGPLVNAIGEPDRRGTYLVSGYRGAGKTSLVIEAARRAKPKLSACDHRLLPLVLNVSEVSASLETAEAKELPALEIDARKLLTALLRALRNGLPEKDPVAAKVRHAYAKAEASQYTETAQERAEAARSVKVETSVTAAMPNVLKAVAAVAGVGVASVGAGALLGVVPGVLVGLAGLAAISFTASRTSSSTTAGSAVSSTELVRDNSLHQIESDLKDILAALDEHGWRTMFVLEELDKVEDNEGKQLDAVIRYFKNLFTQAPALFFFLTDKEYFDGVGKKISAARRDRTYAVEHTFFTHRVFVSRPSLDECLAYFRAVLVGEEAQAALDAIARTGEARSRPVSEMSPVERFLRVLLFSSENHLFDLKNEMRRFVRVEGEASMLAFDDDSLPAQEQAVAALQFVLETKALLYRFGGGRDYANEVLRNCLSEVFANLGGSDPWQAAEVPADLRATERARIREAVESLIGDLERGGAIERHEDGFVWRLALAYSPAPELEPHEQALTAEVERAERIRAQFDPGGPLSGFVAEPEIVAGLAEAHAATLRRINSGSVTVEESQRVAAELDTNLAPLVDVARAAHRACLKERGWQLRRHGPMYEASRDGAESRLRLVYGDPASVAHEQRAFAVVVVDDDPLEARLDVWRTMLAGAAPQLLVVGVPLAEGMKAPEAWWGHRTADELVLARIWLAQAEFFAPVWGDVTAWLHAGTETTRYPTLADALAVWLGSTDPRLGAPPDGGADADRLMRTFADVATRLNYPVIAHDGREWLPEPITDDDHEARQRLVDAGRIVTFATHPQVVPTTRTILLLSSPPDATPVPAVRVSDSPAALRAIAQWFEPCDPGYAAKLFEEAADGGDAEAIGWLVQRGQRSPELLLATDDWPVIVRTAEAMPGGAELLEAGVGRGNPQAMAALFSLLPSEELADKLIATRDWRAVRQAADDSELGRRLLGAAADAGDVEAIERLVLGGDQARDDALKEVADSLTLWRIAEAIDDAGDAERGLAFHRVAARKGDVDSMREVLVRGLEEESRAMQAMLVERGDRVRLEQAAERLDGERAAELRGLIEQFA